MNVLVQLHKFFGRGRSTFPVEVAVFNRVGVAAQVRSRDVQTAATRSVLCTLPSRSRRHGHNCGSRVPLCGHAFRRNGKRRSSADHKRVDIEGDFFGFSGEGFNLSGHLPFGEHVPSNRAPLCSPCQSGDVIDFSQDTLGEPFIGSGPGTFMGTSYSELFYRAQFSFDATARTFPDSDALGVSVLAPFRFDGTIRAFTDAGMTTMAFSTTLLGHGTSGQFFFKAIQVSTFRTMSGSRTTGSMPLNPSPSRQRWYSSGPRSPA